MRPPPLHQERNEKIMNDEHTARFSATLHLRDPRGLHCRVSALLAYRLCVEAPQTRVTLRTPEGREADPRMPYQTMNLRARNSGMVEVEATGRDAARGLEIIRSIVEREPLSREEVVGAIPADVGGDVGEIRASQQEAVRSEQVAIRLESWADLREEDARDLAEWKSPGGFLYELSNDLAPWVERAMEEFGVDDPGRIGTDADGGPILLEDW